MLYFIILGKQYDGNAYKCDQRRDRPDIQRNQASGNRGSYIGSIITHTAWLEIHKARIDEAYDHDGGGGRRLDDSGNGSACQNTFEAIGGQFLKDRLHLVACGGLKTGTHHLHAIQK